MNTIILNMPHILFISMVNNKILNYLIIKYVLIYIYIYIYIYIFI